jgi:hypothetical protein
MRTIVIAVSVCLFLMNGASAALYSGSEREKCFDEHPDNIPFAYECLSTEKKASNTKVDLLIKDSVKRIKANNVGDFNGKEDAEETYGDVYSRRFLDAQIKWKQYRDELCLAVATELNEDAYDYQSFIDQCVINLNKRHIEEIHLLDLPPVG